MSVIQGLLPFEPIKFLKSEIKSILLILKKVSTLMVNGEGPMGMDKLYLTKDQLSTFSSMITVRISKWTHPVFI